MDTFFEKITQISIPVLTIGSQLATSLKYPKLGLFIVLFAQPFWLYSSYKAYKIAGQSGMLVTTIISIFVTIFGIVNYLYT